MQTQSNQRIYSLAATVLAIAAGAFVLWQNSRVAVLWDLGYLLDTGWRIAAGQMPYRDFPLAHAPLTFLTQAALIKIFGRCYLVTEIYAAVTGALSVWLGWLALARLVEKRWVAMVLTVPVVFLSTQGVYPHPIYDTDAGLAVLFAVWLLIVLAQEPEASWWRCVLTGAAVMVPVFYKQNIGLPFAFAVGVAAVVVLFKRSERRKAVGLLGGMFATSIAAVVAMASTWGLGNYYHWTIAFAAQRRMPGVGAIVAIYETQIVYWAVPLMVAGWAVLYVANRNNENDRKELPQGLKPESKKITLMARLKPRPTLNAAVAIVFIVAPFLWTVWLVLSAEDADDMADALLALWPLVLVLVGIAAVVKLRGGVTLKRMIPFVILAAIHGTYLSQQLWGSTYAIWPLLLLLVALGLEALPNGTRWLKPAIATAVGAVILVCGGIYATSLERLSYIDIPDGVAGGSKVAALRGMRTPGEYIANFDELLEWSTGNIPNKDALLLIPGEDPFYYASGRVPQMPALLLDPATDPYTARELMDEARKKDVRWVIVKRQLESKENPMPEREETMRLMEKEFELSKELKGYSIYRRK